MKIIIQRGHLAHVPNFMFGINTISISVDSRPEAILIIQYHKLNNLHPGEEIVWDLDELPEGDGFTISGWDLA